MSKKNIDVLAVGELNVDLILNKIDGFPEVGKEKLAGSMALVLGSSTAIFAANLSKLGTKVAFLGKIGCDPFGELVKNSLISKGIDISFLIEDASISTGATIAMNYGDDRAMVTFPGAMDHLTIADISDEALTSARHLHFSSFFFQPGIRNDVITLFERAKKIGLTTSLDVQWDPSEKWDFDFRKILPNVDLFLPNETEFHHIAGIDGFDEALEIYKPYINNVVIKRGTDGSTLRLKSGELIQKAAYLNLDVVDAIGAGDSFNAGFIHYFLQGKSLAECQDYGSLTGAVSTTQSGGTAAFENMEETCILIEKFRNKLK